MGYIYRFVTPQAILQEAREKAILERRQQGFRGPVGAISLDTRNTIKAFLDYFDKLGLQGWRYTGTCEYPDLPYGGCYVFMKSTDEKPFVKKVSGIKKVSIDEVPLDEMKDEYIPSEQYDQLQTKDEVIYDITNEKLNSEEAKELLEAPSHVTNEVLFRQQKVLQGQSDREADIIDELNQAKELEAPLKEDTKEEHRHELYTQYETEKKGKKAFFRGKETVGFRAWLDSKRAEYDPLYKQYEAENRKCALLNEKETQEYKIWLRRQTVV